MNAAAMLLQPRDNALSAFKYYYYEPSMAAAIIFVILFFTATTFHMYQMIRTRTWFLVPFVIGGWFETVGYIGRAASAAQNPGPYTLGPYIIQSILLLVAPALFAASIYMELGRIVLMVDGQKALFIKRQWLTKIFVIGDVLSFFVQAGGAGLLSSGNSSSINTGQNIVVAGLFLQVIFFGLFVVAGIVFHLKMRKMPTAKSYGIPWEKHMISLYIVSILIFLRSILRVIEYLEGFSGEIMTHEAFLYVFDGTVMFSAMVVMIWIHPSEVKAFISGGKAFVNGYKLQDVGYSNPPTVSV